MVAPKGHEDSEKEIPLWLAGRVIALSIVRTALAESRGKKKSISNDEILLLVYRNFSQIFPALSYHTEIYLGYLFWSPRFAQQPLLTFGASLMVEQANALLDESDAQLFGSVKDRQVVLASSWSSDVLST